MTAGATSRKCGCGCGGESVSGSCEACLGISVLTPAAVQNRAGLPALAWRAGTQQRFKRTMLARLSGEAALQSLTTRDDDDPSISLLDAWATALDVLTFYQERIANENYLGTATERRSVLELARAIGYELAPGVSASTALAFALETSPTAPLSTVIPAGTKVQSIPKQDEKPQLYETTVPLAARGAWNALPVRWRGSKKLEPGATDIYLAGITTGLQIGDAILIVGDERIESSSSPNWDFRRVASIDPIDPTRDYTRVVFDRPLGAAPAQKNVVVYGLRQRTGLFGSTAPDFAMLPKTTRDEILAAEAADSVVFEMRSLRPGEESRGSSFAERSFVGGTYGIRGARPEWPRFNIGYATSKPSTLNTLFLDNAYKAAFKDNWFVVAADDGSEELFRIQSATESGRADFATVGKSTMLTLTRNTSALVSKFWNKLRESAVFLQTDTFILAERPLKTLVEAGATSVELEIELRGDDMLLPGRTLTLSGVDQFGNTVAEVVTLDLASPVTASSKPRTSLGLTSKLSRTYKRENAVVYANVVEANHGETTLRRLQSGSFATEVLGSGDGSQVFQRFVLQQKPLTYVTAANASGRATTLRVRVDGVKWKQVPSFYGIGAEERVYIVRHADDGKVTVQFGDGKTGARLPTGVENVTALYRVGTGLEGQVDTNQLTLLLSRPLGVRDVSNPIPGTGAEDPERFADARANAPLTVLTLDRVVSLRDFEDFARGFAGIGKASAVLLWTGETQTVHLTVALSDGSVPGDQNRTLADLADALDGARHAFRHAVAQGYEHRAFTFTGSVVTDPDYESEAVVKSVKAALLTHFSFASRQFAQDVNESEIIAAIQSVKGVVYTDIDSLSFVGGAAAVDGRLESRPARNDGMTLRAAELLTLSEPDIHLAARPA